MVGNGINDILQEPFGQQILEGLVRLHSEEMIRLRKLSYNSLLVLPDVLRFRISDLEYNQLLADAFYRDYA